MSRIQLSPHASRVRLERFDLRQDAGWIIFGRLQGRTVTHSLQATMWRHAEIR
jgi:hypothetical protein